MITLTAVQCPQLPAPSSLLLLADGQNPIGNSPVSKRLTTGDRTNLTSFWNRNAAGIDSISRFGGGGYAVEQDDPTSLQLVAGSGLNLIIRAGHAAIDGMCELSTDYTLPVPGGHSTNLNRLWIWGLRVVPIAPAMDTLRPQYTTTPVAPQPDCCLIGSILTSSSAITQIDTSGVLYLRGGSLWRQTADIGVPTDAPPYNYLITHRTQTGLYIWDGIGYTRIGIRTRVTFYQHEVVAASTDQNYLIGMDFSAYGSFLDRAYIAQMTCDETKVIIQENQNQKSGTMCWWTVYIPSDAPAGTYGNNKTLLLDVLLAGDEWTGVLTGPFLGNFTDLVPIL